MRALKAKLLSHAHAQLKEKATRTSNQQKHCAPHTNQTSSTQSSHCVYVQSTSSLGWTPELIFPSACIFRGLVFFLVALSFGCFLHCDKYWQKPQKPFLSTCFAHLCNCEGLGFPCMARPYHRHRKPWELGDVLSTNLAGVVFNITHRLGVWYLNNHVEVMSTSD